MSKSELMSSISRGFHKTGLLVQKHSPGILLTVGVIGGVTSAVLACRATVKALPVIDKTKNDLATLKDAIENPENLPENVTVEDCKNDVRIVVAHAALDFAKLYGPAILLGALSITSILASNNILHKRNIAIAAAYATVDKSFKEYRGRVVERFGKELDRELKYNIRTEEVEKKVVDEDGNETTVKETVTTAEVPAYDDYSRVYDDGCLGWTKDPESNKRFLLMQQAFANRKLQENGYLFLNDVYDMLGMPKSKIGHNVGWVYDKNNPSYVDFGIFDPSDERKRAFINQRERNVILNFNPDGIVLDLLTWRDGL